MTLLLTVTSISIIGVSWGFAPHKELHSVAITALPLPLFEFFKANQTEIIQRAVDADKRKHGVENEAAKHYIDLDLFEDDVVLLSWRDACEYYSEDTLRSKGILPWNIERVYWELVTEMSNCGIEGNDGATLQRIIKLSADLGHYVGDSFVPLHTCSNYNGQNSGQLGIHSLWETHVYELTRDNWTGRHLKAKYIENVRQWVWYIIKSSHSDVERVLIQEKNVREREGAPEGWGYRTRGRTLALIPTPEFCLEYSDSLDGMVENRFYLAAEGIASIWYSAWVEAGAPQLFKTFKPRDDVTFSLKENVKNKFNELSDFFSNLYQALQEPYLDDQNLNQ